ncbi:kinase-like domain-containing protein, partial [Lactarius hatsudake]
MGTLVMTERWWRDRYNDIAEHGYRLHPRYDPRWEPSWFKTGIDFYTTDDRQVTVMRREIGATHIRDGRQVVLKKVLPHEAPEELTINLLFSSPEHSGQRDNHCAPLLDVIKLSAHFGSQQLMVFSPLRPVNQPRFQTFGEFATFFTQICEGIRFIHQRNVAHRDCTAKNIMFDLPPNGFHPVKIDRNRNFKGTATAYARTQRHRRYYFINFGLSRQYSSRDSMDGPLRGGDESAPEHRSGQHCNPFHTDIYYIGNLVRQEFMKKCNGFGFMEDLIASMTQVNPIERPPIEDVLQEFSRIRASLSKRKLLTAIKSKSTPKVLR